MRVRRAFAHLQTGRWDLAETDLAEVREHHSPSAMECATRDFVQGLLDLRRGISGAPQRLEQTVATMQRLGVRIWFTSTAAACAESAWQRGDAAALRAAVAPALEQALAIGDRWRAGELAAWLVRAGGDAPRVSVAQLAGPYALEAALRVRDAAEAWARLGCPYEQALALTGGDEADLREALQRFERLGAAPAAEATRRRCVRSARAACNAARSHARVSTRSDSPRASAKCSSSCGAASRMRRSPHGCIDPSARSSTTWPPCWPSSASTRASH